MSATSSATLTKGLQLLAALAADEGRSSLTVVSAGIGMPLATAHRLVQSLCAEGYLERTSKGYFHPGPVLAGLGQFASSARTAAIRLRRPLARLARRYGAFAHFGILEDGMVTYLVKEHAGQGELFTEERMQLEAYCSGIGKVLLAALPDDALDAYLATGPFPALTERTITSASAIRRELETVRESGVAFDRREVRDDLFCVAVPLRDASGTTIAGVSLSLLDRIPDGAEIARMRDRLEKLTEIRRE